MGQQSPFSPQGQFPYPQTLPALLGQPSVLPNNTLRGGASATAPVGMMPATGAFTGVDPAMMAAAQQSLANPDAGDVNTILPSPKALGEGALAGGAVALGMNFLTQKDVFNTGARWLDKMPGAQWLGQRLDKLKSYADKHGSFKEFLMPDAHLPSHSPQADIDKAIQASMQYMEQNQLKNVLGPYQKQFIKQCEKSNALKTAYEKLLRETGHSQTGKYLVAVAKDNPVHSSATLAGVVQNLDQQMNHLKELPNKTKEQKALYKTLRHMKERVSGIKELYKPLYESQVHLTAKLSAEGVGPVGRCFAGFTNYIQRIFNGTTMRITAEKEATQAAGENLAQKGWGLAKKAVGPLLAGVMIFGLSFHAAHNAQDGEKKKTFFHNLLGSQIFNFIGWEFGRKMLNSFQFGSKVFGRAAGKTLPGFLSKIPLVGGITLAGLGTELVAMFLFGSMFQKVGEKISGAIFGRPSQASIDGKRNNQNAQGQLNPAFQTPQGFMNPVWMGAAMPNQSVATQPASGFNPGWTGSPMPQPTTAMPMQRTQFPTGGVPRATAPVQASVPQPRKFSLTPDQIRNSQVANEYDRYYDNLKADKTLDKRPGKLLDRT